MVFYGFPMVFLCFFPAPPTQSCPSLGVKTTELRQPPAVPRAGARHGRAAGAVETAATRVAESAVEAGIVILWSQEKGRAEMK